MPNSFNHASSLTLTDLSLGNLIFSREGGGRGKESGCGLADGSIKSHVSEVLKG